MSDISVEYSKSNRAGCKVCKEKIQKGAIRVGLHSTFDDRDMTQWRCLECFKITKKWKERDPTQITGFDELEEADQERVEDHWNSEGKTAKKTTVKKPSVVQQQQQSEKQKSKPKKKKNKNDSDSEEEEQEDETGYSKTKIKGYTKDQWEELLEQKEKLAKKNNAHLQNILQLNNQKKTGTKDQLIERVADGLVLGQIPRCRECGGGRLRFDIYKGIYVCPGYMEDEDMIRCGKKFDMDTIERGEWIEI